MIILNWTKYDCLDLYSVKNICTTIQSVFYEKKKKNFSRSPIYINTWIYFPTIQWHTHTKIFYTHKIYSFTLRIKNPAIFHAWFFIFFLKIFTPWQIYFLTRKDFVTSVFSTNFSLSFKKWNILICRSGF